jgi:demethylmenaquinone methyltransferase/2-methoxy-6-polyprenyl-1,4-benzoquinol methylase
MSEKKTTDFGFEEIPIHEKIDKVRAVFDRVANKYDLMNDLMSGGLHRLWKRSTVQLAQVRANDKILDLAAGTGDLTQLWAKQINSQGLVVMSDINLNMLQNGVNKLIDAGLWNKVKIVQANAESLPFPNEYFDCVSIGFGLRNMTHHNLVLTEVLRILKPGGKLLVLEFSHPKNTVVKNLYDAYSFKVLPKLGSMIANDAASYRYLAESIRKHPNQAILMQRFLEAGFDSCKIHNFISGIVSLHIGVKY